MTTNSNHRTDGESNFTLALVVILAILVGATLYDIKDGGPRVGQLVSGDRP